MLDDSLTTAAELYKQGKVQKLVVNYDQNSGVNDIELKNLIYQKGVRDFDYQLNLVEDDAYAACYLAKERFGVQSAIAVTQEINIIRDIYTCNAIGIDTRGVISDRSLYQDQDSLPVQVSKLFSSFWKIYITEPDLPIGDKINF
jgi:vancomycin permeability regulator SanA